MFQVPLIERWAPPPAPGAGACGAGTRREIGLLFFGHGAGRLPLRLRKVRAIPANPVAAIRLAPRRLAAGAPGLDRRSASFSQRRLVVLSIVKWTLHTPSFLWARSRAQWSVVRQSFAVWGPGFTVYDSSPGPPAHPRDLRPDALQVEDSARVALGTPRAGAGPYLLPNRFLQSRRRGGLGAASFPPDTENTITANSRKQEIYSLSRRSGVRALSSKSRRPWDGHFHRHSGRRWVPSSFWVCCWAQTPWHEYPAFEYNDFPIPPDYQEKTEWAFARLMYPNARFGGRGFGRFGGFGGDWREGGRGIFWTMDYPRSDRHFSVAIRRLTRLHSRSVEDRSISTKVFSTTGRGSTESKWDIGT